MTFSAYTQILGKLWYPSVLLSSFFVVSITDIFVFVLSVDNVILIDTVVTILLIMLLVLSYGC